MPPAYERFSTADFLTDDDFVNHQLSPTAQSSRFWAEWLAQHPGRQGEWQRAVDLLSAIRSGLDEYAQTYLPEETIQRLLVRIRQSNAQADQPAAPTRQFAWIRWAAAASVLLGIGIWWQTRSSSSPSTYAQQLGTLKKTVTETINSTQKARIIRLPDRSVVTLSPDSRVSYPVDFGQKNRTVYLLGEATFDVTKDTQKPFFVHADELVTRVVGTRFIVRAFAGEDSVRVQVQSGQVSVYQAKSTQASDNPTGVLLLPNQQIVFRRESEQFNKTLVEEPRVIPTLTRRKQAPTFLYTDTPILQILQELKEAYGIEIHYNKEALANCQLTSSMAKESFEEKLNIICTAIGATYDKIDGQIIINGGDCQSP